MSWIKNSLLIILLALLSFGALQKRYGIIISRPLNGVYPYTPKPSISCSTWLKGSYQEQYRLSLEDSVGLKADQVRLYNQLDYSLFGVPHASKMVVGKNGYLFADTYIKGFTGTDFVGKRFINDKVNALKFLQEYLWKEKGILVLVVFAPGKGFYYPEYLPARYLKDRRKLTNYGYYVERCKEEGINYIDFNQWLLDLKDTARYMLYPKTGIHWSSYGAWLCADSLRRYLELRLKRPLPRMVLDSVEVVTEARDEDNDMNRTMNLIWKIPHPLMAYPKFHFKYDSVQPKPAALFVGDSFYWYWYYNGIIEHTFSNREFWYYNNEVYPDHFSSPKNVGQIDYKAGILRQNVIILLQTNGGYGELGYGWIDVAYDYLYPGKSKAGEIEKMMKANPKWMEGLAAKAKERNISTEYMMRLDAIYMANAELRKHPKNE